VIISNQQELVLGCDWNWNCTWCTIRW